MWIDHHEKEILLKAVLHYRETVIPYIPHKNYQEDIDEILRKIREEDED